MNRIPDRRPRALSLLWLLLVVGCATPAARTAAPPPPVAAAPAADPRPRVIFDTDANNELDDQHALAYLLLNDDAWIVEGITTNATKHGGDIAQHTAEAERVVRLCGLEGRVRVRSGANGTFAQIKDHVGQPGYDGHEAVEFILARARAASPDRKLVLIPVGKLTNIALALHKDPSIAANVRVMWLGSNWPRDTREYNEADDHGSVNAVLDSAVELDIALVRGGVKGPGAGTAAVTVSTEEVRQKMVGLGPKVAPVEGRHGGAFTTFGDYSVNLFEKSGSKHRALFDLAAVALVKNPAWARPQEVPAPRIVEGVWQERPENPRKVRFYQDFDRDAIIADFYRTLEQPRPVAAATPAP